MTERYLKMIERGLDEVLPRSDERPRVLHEAMRYAVGTGGKRLRPIICLAMAESARGTAADALYPACAIELLHNYTLVHDDLPAMDNDVERRGKPTVWKAFGEAQAILAGDALLALAYRVAARAPRRVAEIVGVLGEMGVGVVRGQVEDIAGTRGRSENDIGFVYRHKTADLFVAAAVMGALAADGDAAAVAAAQNYALNLGLAFQHEDDLLDGDSPFAPERTEELVRIHTQAAVDAVVGLPGDTTFLTQLAERLTGRNN